MLYHYRYIIVVKKEENSTFGKFLSCTRVLTQEYHAALRHYLKQTQKASLQPALKLGRQAMDCGLETLDLAQIHEQALIAVILTTTSSVIRDRTIKRARKFFAEASLPIEETHQTAVKTHARLIQLNQALHKRTTDLIASNLHLKKEITRRQVVEKTLRQSEQHTSRLLTQAQQLQNQLKHFSRRILLVQEEERKRISRELHDIIAQTLMSINVRLASLKGDVTTNTKGLSKKILHTQRLVEKSVDIVHRFARELRPAMLDDLGLIPALQSFMKGFMKETGIRVSLTTFADVEKLSSAKRTVLYRVTHEALTNVARHANASRVKVSIQKLSNAVSMDISDNGKGFQVKRMLTASKGRRLGLLGIRERVEMVEGKFTLQSAPDKGTTIHVEIPFHNRIRTHTH